MQRKFKQKTFQAGFRTLSLSLFLTGLLLTEPSFSAQSAAIQGRLLNSDGTPVTASAVSFTVQVKSPGSEDCLLYQESQTLNLSNTQGAFAITLGAGTRAAATVDGGNPLNHVFANSAALSLATAVTPCAGGMTAYTPAASDTRKIKIYFDDGSGVDQVPTITMAWVPQATYAQNSGQLGGTAAGQFLKVASGTTPMTLSASDYTALTDLLAGTSSKYMSTSNTEGTTLPNLSGSPSTLAAGKIWYENGNLKYYDGVSTAVKTLGTSSSTGTVTNIASGTGLTGGPITTTGTLSLASGVIATPGTYRSLTVDTYGRVTAGTNPTTAAGYGITDAVIKGGQAGALTVGTSDVNSLTLNTNNSAKMTILSTGEVGIGTTTPAVLLDVQGGGTLANFGNGITGTIKIGDGFISKTAGNGWSWGSGLLPDSDNARYLGLGGARWGQLNVGNGGASQINSVYFATGGNVGIGTTTPGASLTIPSTGNISVGSGNLVSNIGQWRFFNNTMGSLTGGALIFNPAINGYNNLVINRNDTSAASIEVHAGATQTGKMMEFYNAAGSIANVIDKDGNVGLGTTIPTARLHLAAGTTTPGTAPLKLATGPLMTTPEDGAFEYNSASGIWFTIGSNRYVIPLNAAAGSYTNVGNISNVAGAINMTPAAGNSVIVNQSTVSTSSSSGALIVNGGVGVAGAINSAGNISSGGSLIASIAGYMPQIFGSTTAGSDIKIDGADNATKGNVLLATAGGKVGIGTTTPASPLHVNGPNGVSAFTGTTPAAVSISGGNTFGDFGSGIDFRSNQGGAIINQIAKIAARTSTSGSYLQFGTSGSWGSGITNTAMTIDPNGNVGIGTTTPNYLLDVGSGSSAGSAWVNINSTGNSGSTAGIQFQSIGTAAKSYIKQDSYGSYNAATTGSAGHGLNFASGRSGFSNFFFRDNNDNVGIALTTTSAEVSSLPSAMNLLVGGRVGIGTTTPGSLLSVAGDIAIPYGGTIWPLLQRNTTSGGLVVNTNLSVASSGSLLSVRNNGGSDVFTALANGNVGIGTTTPSETLEVKSANSTVSKFTSETSPGQIIVGTAAGASSVIRAINSGAGGIQTSIEPGQSGRALSLRTSGADRLVVGDTGNVGIGTTTPGTALSLGSGQITVPLGSAGAPSYSFSGSTNSGFYMSDSLTAAIGTNGIRAISFYNGGTRFEGGSAVFGSTGVISWTPTGAANAGNDSGISRISAGVLGVGNSNPGNTTGTLLAGAIGIGTTTPGSKLTVDGGSVSLSNVIFQNLGTQSGSVKFGGTGSTGSEVIFNGSSTIKNNGGANEILALNATDSASTVGVMTFSTNSAEKMRINSAGYVGIGTTTPNYKLDVAGDINTSTCFRIGATTVSGTCTSDERLKEDVQDFSLGLADLLTIKLRTYKFNGLAGMPKTGETAVGVVAQELEKTNPYLVKTRLVKMQPDDHEDTEIKVVDYTKFSYIVINAVKELYQKWFDDSRAKDRAIASVNERAEKLEFQNKQLQKQLNEQAQELAAIKRKLGLK